MFYQVVRRWGIPVALSVVTETRPPCLLFHGGLSNNGPEQILKLLLMRCLVMQKRGITHMSQMEKLGLRSYTAGQWHAGSQLQISWQNLSYSSAFFFFFPQVVSSLPLCSSLTPTFLPSGASHSKSEAVLVFASCSFSTEPWLSAHLQGSQVFRASSVLMDGGLTEIP